jgi:hypothetical protein
MPLRPYGTLLDCAKPTVAVFWTTVGMVLALMAHAAQRPPTLASVIRVGTSNPLFSAIEAELGPGVATGPIGHDGQIYYMIARDPFATGPTATALASFDQNPPQYRYRRILFPLLAGGAGRLSAKATVVNMIVLTVLAFGVMAAAIADLAYVARLGPGSVVVAIVNAGGLLSVMLVTADIIGLALGLAGFALFLRGRFAVATTVLAAASLAKETYVLLPLALTVFLALGRNWRRSGMMASASLPLLAWTGYLAATLPDPAGRAANLDLPLIGLGASFADWQRGLDVVQATAASLALLSLGLCLVRVATRRLDSLSSVILPWIGLALTSGYAVWVIPTNALRALAILWPLAILAKAPQLAPRREPALDR